MLSRFHPIPGRYGRTDRQTDRIAISKSRVHYANRLFAHQSHYADRATTVSRTTDRQSAWTAIVRTDEVSYMYKIGTLIRESTQDTTAVTFPTKPV